MNVYYLDMNPKPNGDHEIHIEGCSYLPEEYNRIYLGDFDNFLEALEEAKKSYLLSDGCRFCIPECYPIQ